MGLQCNGFLCALWSETHISASYLEKKKNQYKIKINICLQISAPKSKETTQHLCLKELLGIKESVEWGDATSIIAYQVLKIWRHQTGEWNPFIPSYLWFSSWPHLDSTLKALCDCGCQGNECKEVILRMNYSTVSKEMRKKLKDARI